MKHNEHLMRVRETRNNDYNSTVNKQRFKPVCGHKIDYFYCSRRIRDMNEL